MIRDARPADCGTLTRIVRESRAYDGGYRAMVENLGVVAEDLSTRIVRLHEAGGETRGFYNLICIPGHCELDMMFVANGHTGGGIGRALFADMAAAARGKGYGAILIVSHPPAAGFYERMGAQQVGVEPAAGHVTWERPRFHFTMS